MKINCRSWASIDLNPNGKGKRKLEGRENAEKEKYMATPTTYVFPIHFTMNTHVLFTSVCCGRDTNTLLLHFAIQHFQLVRRSQKSFLSPLVIRGAIARLKGPSSSSICSAEKLQSVWYVTKLCLL